jgi:hypothetical protein
MSEEKAANHNELEAPRCVGLPCLPVAPKIVVDKIVEVKTRSLSITREAIIIQSIFNRVSEPKCEGLPTLDKVYAITKPAKIEKIKIETDIKVLDLFVQSSPITMDTVMNELDKEVESLDKRMEQFIAEITREQSPTPEIESAPEIESETNWAGLTSTLVVPDSLPPIRSQPTSAECSSAESSDVESESTDESSDSDWSVVSHKCTSKKAISDKSKTMMCKHFLAGNCERTDCEFSHDVSAFKPDEQKCFIAGLPSNTSTKNLIIELGRRGYKVINEPVVRGNHRRGFAPKVTLDSIEKCQELIAAGKIRICGKNVTVRKYTDSHRKGNGRDAKSVFIGGLKADTTGEDLLKVVSELGFQIAEKPTVSNGFCQRLVLRTVDMCKAIRAMNHITVNDRKGFVREYQSTHESKDRATRLGRRYPRKEKTVQERREYRRQVKRTNNTSFRIQGRKMLKMTKVKRTNNTSFRIKGREMNNSSQFGKRVEC